MSNKKNAPAELSETPEKPSKQKKGFRHIIRRVFVTTALIIVTLIVGTTAFFFTLHFMAESSTYRASNAENVSIREIAGKLPTDEDLLPESEEYDNKQELGFVQLSSFDAEMLQINPDYVCWISIDGTRVNHPVVRGDDNDKYIDTSFYGEHNDLGTVFMDCRNIAGNLENIIIYGHNSRQGEMFGDLHLLRDGQFLDKHRIITIKVNNQIFEYEIFSVRLTNTNDPAYTIYFDTLSDYYEFADNNGAPLHATQIITLSTCVSRGNDNARLVVQAYALTVEGAFGH